MRRKTTGKGPKFVPVRTLTHQDFMGSQMANFMFNLAQDKRVPEEFRIRADQLRKRWDKIAWFRLDNPIQAAELEARLFPKGKP